MVAARSSGAIHCELVYHCVSPHVAQIHAGLRLLDSSGAVRLSQRPMPPDEWERIVPWSQHTLLVLDGTVRAFYDLHDGGQINLAAAREYDVYFKRSYFEQHVPAELRGKVLPYGLNYELHAGPPDLRELVRITRSRESLGARARAMSRAVSRARAGRRAFAPTVEAMAAAPSVTREPRVLFAVRAWDPADHPHLSPTQVEEWHELNRVRAQCVAMLRREFGARFSGGFQHTPYAAKHFPGELLEDPRAAEKEHYIRLLRTHDIGVATTGLHGSIGWKFGEYVAFSKAIVSEPLRYLVPGTFERGENYLEFTRPQQCVEQVRRLIDDGAMRARMMARNRAYYESYLRPDALVWRTLRLALASRAGARIDDRAEAPHFDEAVARLDQAGSS